MFQKILLPVDLADRHQPALEMAAKLAKPVLQSLRCSM